VSEYFKGLPNNSEKSPSKKKYGVRLPGVVSMEPIYNNIANAPLIRFCYWVFQQDLEALVLIFNLVH